MRISDWSSDVCSSDLESLSRQPARRITCFHQAFIRALGRQLPFEQDEQEIGAAGNGFQAMISHRLDLARQPFPPLAVVRATFRSEEHTSELQSLMRISYAVFCLKKKKYIKYIHSKHRVVS